MNAEAMVLTQDNDTGLVYVEQLPDRVRISTQFLDAVDPRFIERCGNPDDGFTAIFRFANGVAVYELGEPQTIELDPPFSHYDYEGYTATLKSWSPA